MLRLEVTDNIDMIENYKKKYMKYYYQYEKLDALYQVLGNEYYFITQHPYNHIINKLNNFNNNTNLQYVFDVNTNPKFAFNIKNNILHINSYSLEPVIKLFNSHIFNIFILNNIIKNNKQKLLLIRTIDNSRIKDNVIYLTFEVEDYIHRNYNISTRTIYLFHNFSSKDVKYTVNDNNYKDYIIINSIQEMDKMKNFIEECDIILVARIYLFNYIYCLNMYASLSYQLYLYIFILKFMKKNTNLYLSCGPSPYTKPSIETLYFISSLFEFFSIDVDMLNIAFFGYFKFENYKGYDLNIDLISSKLLSLDSNLGQNNISNYKSKYCDVMEKNVKTPNTSIFIKSILYKPMNNSNDFMSKFRKALKIKKRMQKTFMKRVELMKEQGDRLDVGSIIYNNISHSIEYCKSNDIVVSDMYINNSIVNSDTIIKTFFLNKYNNKTIDTTKLILTNDCMFSITRPNTARQMCNIIMKAFPSVKYIIDGCANIGTTTIMFSQYFKHVYSIEYNKHTFDALKNNIDVYGIKNVTLFNADTTLFMKDSKILKSINYNINTYCLCLDPPWEGVFYKIHKTLDLYLSNMNILDIIKNLNIKYICIKAPNNFNFVMLYKYFYNTTIHRLGGFYFIIINI